MNKYAFRVGAACLALLLTRAALPQQSLPNCPGPATNAFTGCYYDNQTLSGNPTLVRTDSQINFNWGNASPDPSLSPDNFSAQWQGNFTFSAGTYTFSIITSDGIRVYFDGNDILDMWRDQAPNFYTVSQPVSAGTHLITVQYYEKTNGATAQLWWTNTSPAAPTSTAQAPVISSFTAQPSSAGANQAVTLAWATSGAVSTSINSGVGDVSTQTSVVVYPAQTTTYVLTATNGTGSVTASTTVTVAAAPDTQPPSTPTLVSAVAKSSGEVDLLWTASSDNVAVAGYQIIRNGAVISSVPAANLIYIDNSVSAGATYNYSVAAFDAAGNVSTPSNVLQVTTPAVQSPVTSSACPAPATNAFTGCYYSNTTLSGNPTLVRTDNQIAFDWGNWAPDPSLTPRDFSVTWQGNFTFAQGTYQFNVITSDGMKISLDGNLVFNQWRDQSPMAYTFTQNISQGTHLISVQYYEETGGAAAHLTWTNTGSTPSQPPAQPPVISSFTATPANSTAGQQVTLAWAVAGATTLTIDQGIGDVTNQASIVVTPSSPTTYTLTASSAAGSTSSTATVNVSSGSTGGGTSGGGTGGGAGGGTGGQTQGPSTPTLVSAIASSPTEVDLTWTASSASAGIASYQILRNGYPLGSVSGSTLTYADTSALTNSSYSYSVEAFDTAGNYSTPSNSIQVTTPVGSGISITWYGPCWYTGTIEGITGNFQAVDFSLTTPTPVPIQGTLFYAPNCPPGGGDNMNDYDTPTPSTHMIQGFTHNVNLQPVSAEYWVGEQTPDGHCPPGNQLCSGCLNYNSSTLSCSVMP